MIATEEIGCIGAWLGLCRWQTKRKMSIDIKLTWDS